MSLDFDEVIEIMRDRPCLQNIKTVKDEIKRLRIKTGNQNSNMSHFELDR